MKIGIITYWQTLDNYGQVLQCYALQHVLCDMGHEPFVVRYDFENRKLPVSILRKIARLVLFPEYLRREKNRKKKKQEKAVKEAVRHFNDFRERYFSFSPTVYKDLESLRQNPPAADCYITGSDQMWGLVLSCYENRAYYLDFGPSSVKRIAYASSFGMKEYPSKYRETLRQCLEKIDRVSCREYDGVKICESVGIEAEKVLDPTLLKPSSFYENLVDKSKNQDAPYMYIYSMNIRTPEELHWEELKEVSKRLGYRRLVTIGSGYIEGEQIFDEAEYEYSTIEQWLSNIFNARLVVTTSFHGIVFCLIFHRPFVYVPIFSEFSKANNRITDLLRDLKLEDRIWSTDNNFAEMATKEIDWNKADTVLEEQKSKSLEFLKRNIKQK